MAELDRINNPNNTDTWRRRNPQEREMDNDGNSGAAASKDYFGNLKKFERHEWSGREPNRNTGNEKGQK